MNIHYYGTNDNTQKARMPKIGDRMPTCVRTALVLTGAKSVLTCRSATLGILCYIPPTTEDRTVQSILF